ncbi:MAG: hypothetical protein ACU84J_11320 [Gammaproteobacteria bacterium]
MSKQITLLALCVAALLAGCGQNPVSDRSETAVSFEHSSSAQIKCLLPARIKRLGANFTYITPRRPVKTAHSECLIRGGEVI